MWTSEFISGREVSVFAPSRPSRFPLVFLTDWDDQSPKDRPIWESLFSEFQLTVYVIPSSDHWWIDRPIIGWPTGPRRWWSSQLLPWLRDRHAANVRGIFGLGIGGMAAIRFGFQHPRDFRAAVSIEGTMDFHEAYGRGSTLDELYESKELARQDTPVLALKGYDVPPHLWFGCSPGSAWRLGNERLQEKLNALGIEHRTDFETITCGHSWDFYEILAPRVIRFLAEGLLAESRKLV